MDRVERDRRAVARRAAQTVGEAGDEARAPPDEVEGARRGQHGQTARLPGKDHERRGRGAHQLGTQIAAGVVGVQGAPVRRVRVEHRQQRYARARRIVDAAQLETALERTDAAEGGEAHGLDATVVEVGRQGHPQRTLVHTGRDDDLPGEPLAGGGERITPREGQRGGAVALGGGECLGRRLHRHRAIPAAGDLQHEQRRTSGTEGREPGGRAVERDEAARLGVERRGEPIVGDRQKGGHKHILVLVV
ncbi:hypothetical protein HR12_25615 [Microbacterium sp. SUBG005]|nr:hypothetical protein HR12_25615 [Microbacterium sp. SUBG005]